jgi:UDP-glucose 4-epimerase
VVDTTRMRTMLGFEPEYSTLATFDDFVSSRGLNKIVALRAVAGLERQLVGAITRLRPTEELQNG